MVPAYFDFLSVVTARFAQAVPCTRRIPCTCRITSMSLTAIAFAGYYADQQRSSLDLRN
jgi:hypothetical protein